MLIYNGSEYLIHFKYSNIFNVLFVTCFYGVGMPLLFPIAAFNMMNLYICERIFVARYVKLPPNLDD